MRKSTKDKDPPTQQVGNYLGLRSRYERFESMFWHRTRILVVFLIPTRQMPQ